MKQRLAALVLAFATVSAGCNFGNSTTPGDAGGVGFETGASGASLVAGNGSGSAASQDFGSVQVGHQSAPASLVVTNSGTETSGLLTASLGGSDAASFGIDTDDCTGKTLAAGQSCTVAAHFLPESAGGKSASFTVGATPGGAAVIALTGQGTVAGGLSITPASQAFGSVAMGASSPATTFTVKSLAASGKLSMSLGGTDSAAFKIGTDGCSGQTLAAGATCTVGVTFSPTTAGSKTASLQASDGTLMATSAVSGTATGTAAFVVTPGTFDFGSLSDGVTSTAQMFAVKNTGGVSSGAPTVGLSGANQGDFAVVTNSCGAALTAGATCTFGVTFTPSTTSTETAAIAVTAPGTTSGSATVNGTGLAPAPIAFNPTTQDFGSELAGQSSADIPFTLTNSAAVATGTVAVTLIGTDAGQFGITPGTCTVSGAGVTLAAGSSCTVSVHFKPDGTVAPGPAQAQLQATATPGGTTVAALTGTITTATALVIAPTSQGFGTVVQKQASSDFPFVVTNNGGVTSGALTVALGGANAGQFALGTDGCSTQTLAAGTSCTVNVHFAPASGVTGVQNATLSVGDTPTDTPSATLTGTATTAASLSITAPTTFTGFGPAANPTVTPDVTFAVINNGGVTTGPLTVALGGANAGQFGLGTDTCNGQTLPPNGEATCLVNVHFAPTAGTVGNEQATLTVSGTPGGSAPLSFVGIAALPATFVITPPTGFAGFGPVSLTRSSAATFTLKNTGGVSSGVPAIASVSKDFVPSAGSPACTTALGAGATCNFVLTFTPSAPPAPESSVVTASAASTVSGTYTATGTGAVPTLVISGPTTGFTGFGTVGVGQSLADTFTLKNTGAVDTLAAPSITSSSPDYVPSAATTPCTGILKAGATCNFVVTFEPAAPNASDTATLTATVTPGNSGTFPLSSVAAEATLAVSAPTAWAGFGPVEVNQTSAPVTFTVTNTGPVDTNTIPMPGSSNAEFAVPTNGCKTTLAKNGGTCTFTVTFTPQLPAGTDSATLTATANDATSVPLTVSGSGDVPVLQVIPPTPTFGFGFVALGQSSAPATFTIKNTGPIAAAGLPSLGTTNGAFAVSSPATGGCTASGLGVNASCNYVVTFTPINTSPASSVLTATEGAANPSSYTVSGQGGQAVLAFETGSLQPLASYSYGGVLVNTIAPVPPPGSLSFYLVNTGTVSSAGLQAMPALAAGFTVATNGCPTGTVLAPNGGKCSITIDFQNATPCASASTSLTMTDGTASTGALALSGTGVTDAADYVITANPASGVETLAPNQAASIVYTMQNCGNVAGNTFVDLTNDCTTTFTTFTYANETCSTTAPLGELASCQFEITVSGTTAGTSKTACFRVRSTGTGNTDVALAPQPTITVN